jgi:nitroreductase
MGKKEERQERIHLLEQDFTQTEKVILSRRSVRLYQKEQVPEFMIKRILEAGRFAPSAANCQPWKFIVLRDENIIYEMTEDLVDSCDMARKMIDYRRPGLRWVMPITKFMIRLRKNDLHPVPFGAMSMIADRKLGLWHGAPTVVLIFADARGAGNPDLDCGIAGQNMVIAAHSMGLGTCWVSFAKLLFEYIPKWKNYFGISYPFRFVSSLAIGWPVGEPNGMVKRQTHAVDWYENSTKETVF